MTLCDLNEEYILSFPNGYGRWVLLRRVKGAGSNANVPSRSILTVPWIELGGNVTINCPKTGYHAEIDFLTKPFYGGKRNKIQGEIYAPNEKKSFLSIYGEWSGLMEAKWNDGSRSKAEVFVDVNRIPIFKKQVRSVMEQEEYESRKIWREVTAGLKWVLGSWRLAGTEWGSKVCTNFCSTLQLRQEWPGRPTLATFKPEIFSGT